LATGRDNGVKIVDNHHPGQHKTLIRFQLDHQKVNGGDRLAWSLKKDRLCWVGDESRHVVPHIENRQRHEFVVSRRRQDRGAI